MLWTNTEFDPHKFFCSLVKHNGSPLNNLPISNAIKQGCFLTPTKEDLTNGICLQLNTHVSLQNQTDGTLFNQSDSDKNSNSSLWKCLHG